MQIMIDTNTDNAATIRKAVAMLQVYLDDAPAFPVTHFEKSPEVPAPPAKITEKVLPFAKPSEAPSAPAAQNAGAIPSSSAAAPTGNAVETGSNNPAPPPPPLVKIPEPPSAPSAPSLTGSATSSAASAQNGPVEYDSAGVPWDARIHQKTKGVKKDRTWKLLKGIDQNIVQGVIAELSANGKLKQADAFVSPSNAAPNPPSSATASVFGKTPLPTGAEAPPPPAAPQAPPPPPPSDAQPGTAFRTLVARFAGATKAGHMTPQQLNALCQANGAPNIMALNSMEHLIPAVNTALDGELLSRGVTL